MLYSSGAALALPRPTWTGRGLLFSGRGRSTSKPDGPPRNVAGHTKCRGSDKKPGGAGPLTSTFKPTRCWNVGERHRRRAVGAVQIMDVAAAVTDGLATPSRRHRPSDPFRAARTPARTRFCEARPATSPCVSASRKSMARARNVSCRSARSSAPDRSTLGTAPR